MAPHNITVAADGQVCFTARFAPEAVGRLNPSDSSITLFPLANPGPEGIAAAPDDTVWFTHETTGNPANISNAGLITQGKSVKGSDPFAITAAPERRPVVRHDGREQDCHTATAVGGQAR